MPRRTLGRRAALSLAVAAVATPALTAPAHAFTDFPQVRDAAQDRQRPPLAGAVRAARAAIGSAYAMGASGPGAFDCSGLTAHALRRAGIAAPHSSFAQFGMGEPVARDAIRAGDLVFFSTNGPGASHVGIATGRGSVVSATSSGVMEHPSTDAYWGGHYVGARRVTR